MSVTVNYLVVAGGGGGGQGDNTDEKSGGGAGAGGFRAATYTVYENDSYTITIGAGGAGAQYSGNPPRRYQLPVPPHDSVNTIGKMRVIECRRMRTHGQRFSSQQRGTN